MCDARQAARDGEQSRFLSVYRSGPQFIVVAFELPNENDQCFAEYIYHNSSVIMNVPEKVERKYKQAYFLYSDERKGKREKIENTTNKKDM